MVTRLPSPSLDHDEYLDQVVEARQEGVNAEYFTGMHAWWKERVRRYITELGNPENIPESEVLPDDKGKFNNLYINCDDESVHGAVLKTLRDGKPQFCPACGEAGQPNTLDHYLPKGDFPEFSIAPINLFPMCDTCQGFKGTFTTDENGNRYFIHPYFDDFANKQILVVTFEPPFKSPTMTLKVNEDLDPAVQSLTSRHVKKLQIEPRFQHFMKDEHSRLLRLAQDVRAEGGDVRGELGTFARNAKRRSINFWDHIWYASVLEDGAFVDYLAYGQLPAFR